MPLKRLATRSRSGLGMGWLSPHLGLLQHSTVHQLISIIQAAQKGNTHPVQPETVVGSPADSAKSLVPTAHSRFHCSPEVRAGVLLAAEQLGRHWDRWNTLRLRPLRRFKQRLARYGEWRNQPPWEAAPRQAVLSSSCPARTACAT